ncbi:MAG: linear amide C-N hydrolase [Theionarchaea archaeon]|nr:linear amide C-N hydrolase [Theionarchaea archaeon]
MKCNETTILNKDRSFMTVRHLVIKGTNFEIGKKLAEIAIKRHNLSQETVITDDPVVTHARRNYFARNYPIHLERARGVAVALGVDLRDDWFDVTEIPYNWDLLPLDAPMACSVVYYPPQTTLTGSGYLSRNYDFPTGVLADIIGISLPSEIRQILRPMMADTYIIEMYPEDGGYASLYLTCFELLSTALDGINSEGLMVSINADDTSMVDPSTIIISKRRIGLHEFQGMRLLLDTCATVEEAKEALLINKHFHRFMPCHYFIADRDGNSFVYEHSNGHNHEYIIDGTNKPFVVTNHPLHRSQPIENLPEKTNTSSYERYKVLIKAIERSSLPYTTDLMKEINTSVSVSQVISWIPNDQRQQIVASPGFSRTLWHCIYDSNARCLEIKFYLGDELTDNGNFIELYTDYTRFLLER